MTVIASGIGLIFLLCFTFAGASCCLYRRFKLKEAEILKSATMNSQNNQTIDNKEECDLEKKGKRKNYFGNNYEDRD